MPHMENPATLATCGAPKNDLADASIASENSHLTLALQVFGLTRLCGISAGMAETLAPMVFGVLS